MPKQTQSLAIELSACGKPMIFDLLYSSLADAVNAARYHGSAQIVHTNADSYEHCRAIYGEVLKFIHAIALQDEGIDVEHSAAEGMIGEVKSGPINAVFVLTITVLDMNDVENDRP